jgi:hypothetical protein
MLRTASLLLLLVTSAALPARAAVSVELRGSPASMHRQNQVAKESEYTFLGTPDQVENFVEKGRLVRIEGDEHYAVSAGVSFPFARPEVRTFLERLGVQHHEACGERLVVTSLTRPRALQPANAHALSVHPAGMAVDLRISNRAACREWLEDALLSLEKEGVLDATRERRPPHYHIAVFPAEYAAYVARLTTPERPAEAEPKAAAEPASAPEPAHPAAPVHASAAAGGAGAGGGTFPGLLLGLSALGLALGLRRERAEARAAAEGEG